MFCCCGKDEGGQGAASGMRPPQMGAGWFPSSSSDAMPSKVEQKSFRAQNVTDDDSDLEETGDVEEMEAEDVEAAEEHQDEDTTGANDLQSYYEIQAAERAEEEANQVEETDSDEDEEAKEFEEEMKEASRELTRHCGEEKSRLKRLNKQKPLLVEDWDEELHTAREETLSHLRKVAQKLVTEEPETAIGAMATDATVGGSEGSLRAKTPDLSDSVGNVDRELINMRYKQKVTNFLKDREDDVEEDDLERELLDYHHAVRARLAKLSGGDGSQETFSPAKDRAEAVKECVKKYHEKCEQHGLFKAFSADDVPEDGLGNDARNELLDNINTLSDDVKE